MRILLYIFVLIAFWLFCGGIVKAQTVYYDSTRDAHYAYLWGNGDTAMTLYLQPVYMGDTAADVRYQIWYSVDTVDYLPYQFGVQHISGSDYTSWVGWNDLFLWIGNSERLNLTYK